MDFDRYLEDAMKKKELNITEDVFSYCLLFQESKKLKKAFEDPKFCEMFADYLKEIADPKNRAVYLLILYNVIGTRRVYSYDGTTE